MSEIEPILHLSAAVVSIAVAALLFPLVKKSLALKSGLVFEMGWMLLLPGIFIALFSTSYAVVEYSAEESELVEMLEMLGELFAILASVSVLMLAMKIRSYMNRMEE